MFNLLLHKCQKLDLDLALLEEAHSHEASERASKLLDDVRTLDKEIDDMLESIEHHQAVYHVFMTSGEERTTATEKQQLDELSELITTLKDVAEKVWL